MTCLLDHGWGLLGKPWALGKGALFLQDFPIDAIAAFQVILQADPQVTPGRVVHNPCYQWSLILLLTVVFVLLMHPVPGNAPQRRK